MWWFFLGSLLAQVFSTLRKGTKAFLVIQAVPLSQPEFPSDHTAREACTQTAHILVTDYCSTTLSALPSLCPGDITEPSTCFMEVLVVFLWWSSFVPSLPYSRFSKYMILPTEVTIISTGPKKSMYMVPSLAF